MSQYADDTTLTLDGSEWSLITALNTLEIYAAVSGLLVNRDKTRIVWIGKKDTEGEKNRNREKSKLGKQ